MKKTFFVVLLILLSFQLLADDDKLRLAVMEFEDRSGEIPKKVLQDATEYLRGALISANKYIVIAQERQSQAMVKDMKKESYKECNDKNCQIQLGQALSADTILRTTITRLGQTFVIASELIDLEKEATVVGAREKYDGTENSMSEALDNIAEKVIAAYESIQNSQNSEDTESTPAYSQPQPNPQQQPNYQSQPNYSQPISINDDKRGLSEAQNNLKSGRKIKIAGYSMLGVGGGISLVGSILFSVSFNNDDDSDGLIIGSFSMLAIGSAAIITGVIMAPVGAVREKKARIKLETLSITPTKGGAYAQVGFTF